MAVRIVVLLWTKDYVIYLLIELLLFIVQTLFSTRIVDRKYAYIRTKETYKLGKEETGQLIRNVKALFFHNIGSYFVFGTDNILISTFIGVATVGLYSNYTMLIGQLGSILLPTLNGMGASVGNLIAKESKEKSYAVFNVMYFINFWVYSASAIFLYNIVEPFITWWLGREYLLDSFTLIMILANFYVTGMRASVLIFKNKSGIFVQDKYMPLAEAAINLGSSLILVKYLGLPGIFLGTLISTLSIAFWNVPRLVFKLLFQLPVRHYFKKYALFAALTIAVGWITTLLSHAIVKDGGGIVSLLVRAAISLSVPNLIYLGFFYKREEFAYIVQSAKRLLSKPKAAPQVTPTS
jgi:O-antigen/teichoic acid export membrane protein